MGFLRVPSGRLLGVTILSPSSRVLLKSAILFDSSPPPPPPRISRLQLLLLLAFVDIAILFKRTLYSFLCLLFLILVRVVKLAGLGSSLGLELCSDYTFVYPYEVRSTNDPLSGYESFS
jgi:hypothetical protein